MLVITRKIGEELMIGDNVCIRIIETSKGRTRMAITAPRTVRVLRSELINEESCADCSARAEVL